MTDTISDLSHVLTCARPEHSVVAVREECTLLWRDYTNAVSALAAQLKTRPEQRWLLCFDDSYQFAIGFMALLHSAKTVILPPNAQPGTLRELAQRAQAMLSDCDPASTALPVISPDQYKDNLACATTARLSALNPRLTIEVMTSGSEGASKTIVKNLQQFAAEVWQLEQMWGQLLNDSLLFSTVSHQHIYGLLFRVLWPLCAGRAFVASNYQYPETLFADMQNMQKVFTVANTCAALISSPAHLKRIPEAIDLLPLQNTLKAVFSSGGPLPAESAVDLERRTGIAPLEVLGSSETGGVAWRAQHTTQTDTPWQHFDTVDVRSNDDGLLEIKSPFCYTDQWFVMGDKVEFANSHHFYLKGRADRIVKIEEKRLSLTQMEQTLLETGWLQEVRILPLSGRRTYLALVAVVSPEAGALLNTKGKRALNTQIKNYLLQFFERVVLPRKFRYVKSLPVNKQGKVVMSDLKALFKQPDTHAVQPLINIIEHSPDKIVMTMDLPADHDVFAGHFPQWPVLPGVVQLDIASRQARHYFYPHWVFKRVERLKFQSLIRPGNHLRLTLQDLGGGKVACHYSRAEQVLSGGTIVYGEPDAI